ncbi:retrovirus-related pol polyprotein from transposon TNT 1-94 [Tanacetum coccineum]
MSGTIPPIPPPFGTSSGNPGSPNVNRVDTMPTTTDPINTTTTTNVSQSVVDENLPQLLDSRGGSHVTNVPAFDKEDFTSWKVRFLVFLDGLEPYLLKTLEDGPFVPMSSLSTSENPLPKRQNQWSNAESRLANQDKRLKSIIISCLPNDVMKSVIKCKTAKEMWNDLILAHEGPSDTRDTKIAALRLKFNAFKSLEGEKVNGTFTRLKCLLNDLENNGVTIPQAEVNATFVNSLPRKWLSMNQTQRANNSIKNDCLATLYGKYNYEEGLIDQIYESETQRFSIQASSSKALISNNKFQDSDSDVEEDQRTTNEFMADLNAEYHERALLANQKRFYKRSGRVGSAKKPIDKTKETCFACGKTGHFQKELITLRGPKVVLKMILQKTQKGTIYNQNDEVVLIAPRRRDVYVIDMSSFNKEINACFFAKASSSVNWLWQKRLSHLNFKNINNLAKHNLVSGLPSLNFSKDKNCSACEKGKHHRASFKTKRSFSINKSLHILHMDLFRPVKPQTISHNKYTLVIVDEKMENLNEVRVKELRSDNETEFRNHKLEEFYDENGISQNFSSPCTPEQNGVVERRNRTLIEAARTMLNRRSPDIIYFYIFGCPVHIHNHRDHLGKFDEKADDGFFLGYSPVAKAFSVFNIRRQEMEEIVHVTFSEDDEAISQSSTECNAINFNENRCFPDDEFLKPMSEVSVTSEDPHEFTEADNHLALNEPDQTESADPFEPVKPQNNISIKPFNDVQPSPTIPPSPKVILQTHVPQNRWSREKHIKLVNIIGEPLAGIITRSWIRDSDAASASECLYVNFLSEMEPKKLIEALKEEGWIIAYARRAELV